MKHYKRPNILLYGVLGGLLKLYAFFKGQRILQKVNISKPSIVLSNHTSFYDFIYTTTAVYPNRINYLAADKMFYDPGLGFFLKLARAIPKCLFQQDLVSIRATKKILEQKGIIGIFPEGQISSIGRTNEPPYAIAKLIKRMNVDVYIVKHENAYFVNPPWTKRSFRGKLFTTMHQLFSKEELEEASEQAIFDAIVQGLYYDAGSFNKEYRFIYKPNDIDNLESLIYRCPECGVEDMTTNKHSLVCKQCSHSLEYNKYGLLNETSIGELYDAQAQIIKDLVDQPNFRFESEVLLESYRDNRVKQVGKGILTLTQDKYTYLGTIDNEQVYKEFQVKNIPYLPSDIGKNIQIYYDYQLYQFVFSKKSLPIKFVIAGEYLYRKSSMPKL